MFMGPELIKVFVFLGVVTIWAVTSLFNREDPARARGPARPYPPPGPRPGGGGRPGDFNTISKEPPVRWSNTTAPQRTAKPPVSRAGAGRYERDDDIILISDEKRGSLAPTPSLTPGLRKPQPPVPQANLKRRSPQQKQPASRGRRGESIAPPLPGVGDTRPSPMKSGRQTVNDSSALASGQVGGISSFTTGLIEMSPRSSIAFNPIANSVRQALGSVDRVRSQIIIHEILQPPVSMREPRPSMYE